MKFLFFLALSAPLLQAAAHQPIASPNDARRRVQSLMLKREGGAHTVTRASGDHPPEIDSGAHGGAGAGPDHKSAGVGSLDTLSVGGVLGVAGAAVVLGGQW